MKKTSTKTKSDNLSCLSKVSRSHQITIPAQIRHKLDIRIGEYVKCMVTNNVIIIKPASIVDDEDIPTLDNLLEEMEQEDGLDHDEVMKRYGL